MAGGGQKRAGVRMPGGFQNLCRRAGFNNLTGLHNQQVIGHLRIVPGVPLDRSLVPEDAPSVPAYLLVIVDDADINKDNLIDFEERASYALLKRFSTEAISFQHCQFYYPSPAFIFEQADALTNPVM